VFVTVKEYVTVSSLPISKVFVVLESEEEQETLNFATLAVALPVPLE
jgi:hypothetical protein